MSNDIDEDVLSDLTQSEDDSTAAWVVQDCACTQFQSRIKKHCRSLSKCLECQQGTTHTADLCRFKGLRLPLIHQLPDA